VALAGVENGRSAVKIIQQLCRDTSGATMVEYALMITFIALVAMVSAITLGTSVNTVFNHTAGLLK
jgi:Flp pilus assembly pilin Flp